MLTLVGKNGNRRFEAKKGETLDDILYGMHLGLTLGVGLSCWLFTIEVVSGPGAFERLGLTWNQLGMVYCAGAVAVGAAIGALRRMRHHPTAVVLMFLLVGIPALVAIPLNMSLSYGRLILPLGELVLLDIIVLAVMGWIGFLAWREETRVNPPSAGGRRFRLERFYQEKRSPGPRSRS